MSKRSELDTCTVDNPFIEIARKTHTITVLPDEVKSIFLRDREHLQGEDGLQLWAALWELVDAGFTYSQEHGDEIDKNLSLLDWFNDKIKHLDVDEQQKDRLSQLSYAWGAFVGDSISTQSLKNLWLEAGLDGDTLFVADSYKKMLKYIADPVITGASIYFSSEVSQIKNIETTAEGLPSCQVKTSEGQSKTFDQVIVTSPLGYLQQHEHLFDPAVPQDLSRAIHAIHYGHLEKVYIHFPEAWWEPKSFQRGSDSPPGYESPHGHAWTCPAYAKDTNPGQWTQQAIMYSVFPGKAAQPVILFYIFGANAAHIHDSIKDLSPSSKEYNTALTAFFAPYYSQLPEYDANDPRCVPDGFLATDWSHDRLAGNGSYTNYQVGLDDGKGALDCIRAGMGIDRGIWLAGEHAAPYVALGTVVGAYWSGERVARQIAAMYGLGETPQTDPTLLGDSSAVAATGPSGAKTNLHVESSST